MAGNQALYRPQERAAGLFAVQLLICQPQALIPVKGQKSEIGGNFWIEKWLQHTPLGSPGASPSEPKLPLKCGTLLYVVRL